METMSAITERQARPAPGLTVSEVAAAAGVAASAVRFYEQHGLVTAERTAGNQRRFDDRAVCLIRVAKVAQRVGMTVREIAEALAILPAEPSPQDWYRFRELLVAEAEARVRQLREQLDDLGSEAKLCDLA